MIIHVPIKNTLIIDDFKFRCCVGKKGLKLNLLTYFLIFEKMPTCILTFWNAKITYF